MSVKSGRFKCPKCGDDVINGYDMWEKKGDKWILKHSSTYDGWEWALWYSEHNGPDDDTCSSAEQCWSKYGGSTVDDWNKSCQNKWTCDKCKETRKSLLEFIKKNNNNY